MHFTLTDEQEQMQTAARDFFESNDAIELARRQLDDDDAVIDELWDKLDRVDYTAVSVPAKYGGLGDDILYTTLLLEEAGRVAMPGPYPETMAFAVPLIAELGTDEQKEEYLSSVADGNCRIGFALYDDETQPLPDAIRMTAEPTDDGYQLAGTKTYVPAASAVDVVIVAARTQVGRGDSGITLFLLDPDRVESRRLDSLDGTRPFYELIFEKLSIPKSARLGVTHDAGPALQRATDRYRTAICGMLVGAAERAVELSVEYGNSREQFGHPVGRYQSVKHRTVDMWMDLQAGRSLVYYAAWALSNEEPDAPRAVSAAKSFCSQRFPELFADDIQNQGAMGTTWDHDTHIFLKQAKAWENFLGTPAEHYERIIDAREF